MRCFVLQVWVLSTTLCAQNPPLAPTANVVLDTNPTQGHFAFSSIAIPAGVTVLFAGTYAVQIRCDGDASIDGILSADAVRSVSGPGSSLLGKGAPGNIDQYSGGYPGGDGVHAGHYGSAQPFDLAGGSPAGDTVLTTYSWNPWGPPLVWTGTWPGGGGGGTLVLEADGRIDLRGRISANGALDTFTGTYGSGGSVLLRARSVVVHPSARLQARTEPGYSRALPGYVRVDAYAQAPVLQGSFDPAPLSVTLPELIETSPPQLGSTWQLDVYAPRGDGVFLAASFIPGSATNNYGSVGIDIATAITFALVAVPAAGHDPRGVFQLSVPNDARLLGLPLWTAGLDWFTAAPPHYTNTVATVVQ